MAEAQQEQPQAHQPQPEPVFAAAEELAHALPHQSRVRTPSPQATVTQEQENRQGAQGQVQVQVQIRTEAQPEPEADPDPEPDANVFDHAHVRAPTPILHTANNATATAVAAAHAQEQEWARERDPEQDQDQDQEKEREQEQGNQLLPSNHSVADIVNPISTSNSTPAQTSTTASPVTVPTTNGASSADQTALPSATAATNGVPPDQKHQLQQEEGGVAPSSEAMSNNPPHHPQGPPRHPTGYPTPTGYATPGMGSAHYGYANPAGQASDAYRASAGVPSNAMALPSMRTFDAAQQQAQQQQHMAMAMPVNPVPSVPSMPAQHSIPYFGQQPVSMAANNPYGLPPDALRPQYNLPPSGPGSVLGGRHKKEIKRRTKTGCLTCRKRRIKCDEQHPVCKNCQKSKRECLGYDPIFKNQQTQHPTNIRPAPNNPASSASVPPSRTPTSSASVSASASGSAQAQAHAQAQAQSSYSTTLPPVIPNNTTPTSAPFTGNLTAAGTAASTVKGEPLEYPTAIDPTLDPVLNTTSRKMKVHELVNMSGTVPPALDSPLTSEKLAEVRDLYDQVYAPGLEKFFETEWYTKPQGVGALMSSQAVNEMLAGFLQSMAKTDASDVAGMQYSANLEFRVVWDLAALVYTSEYKVNVGQQLPPPDDGSEARNRVAVFEALLSGDYLDQNPLQPPPANADIRIYRPREFKFWYCLAEFLRIRDQPGLDMTGQRDYILGQMRELLDGRENRDVLYSLAVIRALAPNFPSDFESTLPPHLDESDPKNKLAVARKFIQDESQVTGGTTNVVRRFSELAVRAFIVPGSNIVRR